MNILTVNLILSTLVFWIAARIYVLPKLHELNPKAILLPILLLHSLRHLGLMFLAPGAIYAGAVRLSGRSWRSGRGATRVNINSVGGTRSQSCTNRGLDLQHRRNSGSSECDHPGHGLRGSSVYGTCLLDSGFLGSRAAGHPLHRVRDASRLEVTDTKPSRGAVHPLTRRNPCLKPKNPASSASTTSPSRWATSTRRSPSTVACSISRCAARKNRWRSSIWE